MYVQKWECLITNLWFTTLPQTLLLQIPQSPARYFNFGLIFGVTKSDTFVSTLFPSSDPFFTVFVSILFITFLPWPLFQSQQTAKMTAWQFNLPVWLNTAISPTATGSFALHSRCKPSPATLLRAIAQGFWSRLRFPVAVPTRILAYHNEIRTIIWYKVFPSYL